MDTTYKQKKAILLIKTQKLNDLNRYQNLQNLRDLLVLGRIEFITAVSTKTDVSWVAARRYNPQDSHFHTCSNFSVSSAIIYRMESYSFSGT
jgi:hypothetical protein